MPAPAANSVERKLLIGIAVGLVVIALLVGGLFVATRDRGGDSAGAPVATSAPEADEIVLEPAAVEVADPFTRDLSVDEAPITAASPASTSDDPVARTGAGGGSVTGASPGLYGGTRDDGSCDQEQLVSFLESDEEKGRAWARVAGIDHRDIATYVDELTPVVLRRDTRVMNHGYRDGRATPRPAVLQAGTAVLVDEYGVPRVKCNCGNPLGDPLPVTTATRHTGPRWTGFEPDAVVVVRVDVRVEVLVLVDLRTGEPFGRPVGSDGRRDGEAPGAPTTTTPPVTTTAPATTRPETTQAPAPSGDRSQEAISWVERSASACDPLSHQYIVGYRAQQLDADLYEVEMQIELEPGMGWSAFYTVDFATQDFPTITAGTPEAAAMLCL